MDEPLDGGKDRHGLILPTTHATRGLRPTGCREDAFDYLRAGFAPDWDRDPYRVFVYTSLQERATQISHANTGKVASEFEPLIGEVLANVAKEEARHYTFYRSVFKEVLKRDPNQALESAAKVMPAIDMPGVNMPHFREMPSYPPCRYLSSRDYLKIVEEQINSGLSTSSTDSTTQSEGQEKIRHPCALERIAGHRGETKRKTFSFDVAFRREFVMD